MAGASRPTILPGGVAAEAWTLSADTEAEIAGSTDASSRRAILARALESSGKTRWGESVTFCRTTLPELPGKPIVGLSRLLQVTAHARSMAARDEPLVTLATDAPSLKDAVYYPAHFLTLFSRRSSAAERREAKAAIREQRAGMNCTHFVYALLWSQGAAFPTAQYRKYRRMFELMSARCTASPNIQFEPLGFAESRPFGWKACTFEWSVRVLAKPPDQRGGAQVDSATFDPYHPFNPKPGDLVFVTAPPADDPFASFAPSAPGWSAAHVCLYLGTSTDGRRLVASNYCHPLERGNTASVVPLDVLMEELARASTHGACLRLSTFPLEAVPERIDRFIAEQSSQFPDVGADLTPEEAARLHLF